MDTPIVFISTHRIKQGKLDDLRQFMAQGAPRIEQSKPGTVGFAAYLDPDAGALKIVHIFPNDQAMIAHFEGAEERAGAAWEFIKLQSHEVFGPAPESLVEGLKQMAAEMDAELSLVPEFGAGFLRLKAG